MKSPPYPNIEVLKDPPNQAREILSELECQLTLQLQKPHDLTAFSLNKSRNNFQILNSLPSSDITPTIYGNFTNRDVPWTTSSNIIRTLSKR